MAHNPSNRIWLWIPFRVLNNIEVLMYSQKFQQYNLMVSRISWSSRVALLWSALTYTKHLCTMRIKNGVPAISMAVLCMSLLMKGAFQFSFPRPLPFSSYWQLTHYGQEEGELMSRLELPNIFRAPVIATVTSKLCRLHSGPEGDHGLHRKLAS